MKATIDGVQKDIRAVWFENGRVMMIDQRKLPAGIVIVGFDDYLDVAEAIRNMTTRGAPSIGATAACVPLTIAAAPFVARMVEQSLEEIDRGTVEAARCMGATNWQIVTRVLLVESVPSLLRGLSISTITILGYTAITGAVGAGGLGNIAFRFGYQRYQKDLMYVTVVLLILLVCLIQGVFNLIARRADKRSR